MIKEQVDKDTIEAMKSKEEIKVSVLRMLKSAIKNSEIQKGKELEDADILQTIQGQIKSRRDSIDLYEKGNRPELAQKEKDEIAILEKYLPTQMDEEEIRELVKKAIAQTGAAGISDMGKVMGKLIPETRGKADGSLVSKIVKEELNK